MAGMGLAAPTLGLSQILFSSNLDTSTGWTLVQESTPSSLATFGYDYSAVGIPASPNGGGSTTGLRLAANGNSTIQAITAATTASFTGQYRVTFDFWSNALGPFPAGGAGSTEFTGGGVGFSGTAPRAGASLLISGEGGSAVDWRMSKGADTQTIASGSYNPAILSTDSADLFLSAAFPGNTPPASQTTLFSQQTGKVATGTIAFGWYTMTIDVDTSAGTAAFSIRNPATGSVTPIGTLSQTGGAVPLTGSGSLTVLDPFGGSVSNADLPNDLVFGVFDNYQVAIPEPGALPLLGLAAAILLRRRR